MTSSLLRKSSLSCLTATLLAVAGCSGAATSTDAGEKTPDSGSSNNNQNDAGNNNQNDAGNNSMGAAIGAACTASSACSAADCLTSLPGGYCSLDCTAGEACPSGSTCVEVSASPAESLCLANCAATSDCRTPDYSCDPTATVCVPGCSQDSDCTASGLKACDPNTGMCVQCTQDSDCKGGKVCDLTGDATNETCVAPPPVMDGGPSSMDAGPSVMDGGTPPDMDAGPIIVDAGMTIPPPATGGVGAACTTTAGCTEGPSPLCLTAADGWHLGYCTTSTCTDDSDCNGTSGTGNICETGAFQNASGTNVPQCLHACNAESDCRTDYNCVTYLTQSFCFIACTTNADCLTAAGVCDTTTGYCSDETPVGTNPADAGPAPVMDGGTTTTDAGPPPPTPDGGMYTTVPLTGCAFVGYNTPVTIGTQTFTMSIDTGSTTMGVADTTCGTGCDSTVASEFNPTGLTSLGAVSAEYGSGSWVGKIYSDTVQVGPEMPAVTMDFAGITSQKEFFLTSDCSGNTVADSLSQGILGMGPLTLSEIMMNNPMADDAYVSELVAQAGITNEFAVQLCSSGGNMWFGGYDPSYATGTPVYTPLVSTDGYYAVSITSAGLGGTALGGTWGQSVVDTGTWGFLMPTAAYTKFVSTIAANAATTALFSGANALSSSFWSSGNCVSPDSTSTTRADIDAALPPLTLVMPQVGGGSFTLSLPASSSYLITIGSGSTAQYCGGVSDNTGIGIIIMGAAAQAANITLFDPANSQIGFVSGSICP